VREREGEREKEREKERERESVNWKGKQQPWSVSSIMLSLPPLDIGSERNR
jgi:hypothetical protein